MKRLIRLVTLLVTFLIIYVLAVWILMDRTEPVSFDKLRTQWSGGSSVSNSPSIERDLQELAQNNAETVTFVDNYPNRAEYLGLEIDLSEEVQEDLVPLFMQWDMRWGYEAYGDNIIALAGCGPTCLSMAYVYLTGDLEGNPREMSKFADERGFHTEEGTSWDLWTLGAEDLGIMGEELPLDEGKIKGALDSGGVVVCSMRPGDFTQTGHYILIRGYDENGFYVNDPNSRGNSQSQWLYTDLKQQIKNLWILSP